MTTSTVRRPAADSVLTAAVDIAREAAVDAAARPEHVGDHLGSAAEGERLVTHRFGALDPAYSGWLWAVTVARVPRSKAVTVCEAVLLPGDDALLAKAWVPWSERLAPGDLGVGDLLPSEPDDDRLEPGYTAARDGDTENVSLTVGDEDVEPFEAVSRDGREAADDDADRVALWELGLGRARVLSPVGRDDAVDRWYSGEHGPTAAIAEAAPAPCSTCGFITPLAGALRRVFGVCTNVYSPSDGQVVSYDHGCGAHSEVAVLPPHVEVAQTVVDEEGFDVVTLPPDE